MMRLLLLLYVVYTHTIVLGLCVCRWWGYYLCYMLYSLLHLECHFISISNLNLLGLFPTERGKRDLENQITDWDLRTEKWQSKCSLLYLVWKNLNLQARSRWSLFNRTWQKRPTQLDHRLRFEIEVMTLHFHRLYNRLYIHTRLFWDCVGIVYMQHIQGGEDA